MQELQEAHAEEGRLDELLSLMLPADVMAAVKSSDADSLCSAERFKVRCPSSPPLRHQPVCLIAEKPEGLTITNKHYSYSRSPPSPPSSFRTRRSCSWRSPAFTSWRRRPSPRPSSSC